MNGVGIYSMYEFVRREDGRMHVGNIAYIYSDEDGELSESIFVGLSCHGVLR